jgi:hypothetical protein
MRYDDITGHSDMMPFSMMTGLFTSAQIEGDGDDTVLYPVNPVNMERLAILGSVSHLVGWLDRHGAAASPNA